MGQTLDDLKKIVDDLARQRDELNLKIHLAKADMRDEWDRLESKWEEVQGKLTTAGKEAEKTAGAVTTGIGLIADEIKKGYERIRNAM